MMQRTKTNKLFLLLLTGTSLVIWSVIVYQIVWGISYNSESINIDHYSLSKTPIKTFGDTLENKFSTQNLKIRDPFKPFIHKKKKAVINSKPSRSTPLKTKLGPMPPVIRYIGYLGDPGGNLAIIEMENGNTKICIEGDTLQGVKLNKIEKYEVQATFLGKPFQISLQK